MWFQFRRVDLVVGVGAPELALHLIFSFFSFFLSRACFISATVCLFAVVFLNKLL